MQARIHLLLIITHSREKCDLWGRRGGDRDAISLPTQ